MKSTQQLLKNAIGNEPPHGTQKGPSNAELDALAARIVNYLFAELKSIFPAWRSALPTDMDEQLAKKTWSKAFIENELYREDQIRYGLKVARCQNHAYFPSVGMFIQWCQPTLEDLGLPSVRDAYLEACRKAHSISEAKWTHPAIFVATRDTGVFDLRSKPEAEMYPKFQSTYMKVYQRVLRGEDLSFELPKALPPASVSKPMGTEAGVSAVAELRKKLGLPKKEDDHERP
ncbi:replication protein P [Grimontia kaedaensis]|uniref:Replication protein P n=1 Tax=Grimontia kaedaensis TaxID=2872157 RepID=A0ABY4WNF6_9GAMM|nr:replication protein P [Grimontia kaedaensis]USH01103.1 replication protein P [Grimontia kaedaensis]